MSKRFTKDPVEVLITKLHCVYGIYKAYSEEFKDQDEYSVLREILSVIEKNNKPQRLKPKLKLLKEET